MATSKKHVAPRKRVSTKSPSVSQMAEVLLSAVPDLQEAYTRADIELALDDRGWLNLSGKTHAELDPQTRKLFVQKSRLYWQRDPMAKQAVRLWTDYGIGTGITYQCDDAATMKTLDDFMQSRDNRRVTSSAGQRKLSKKLLIDGELFMAVFTTDEGKCIRSIDPIQITDFICDPDDSEHILAYRRVIAGKGKQEEVMFYADWAADDDDKALAEQQKDCTSKPVVLEEDVVVYFIPFDDVAQRGNGLLNVVVDWTREHRRFMEARVAITQALAKFAYKLTVKGGQGMVNSIKQQLESTYAQGGANKVEKHPQNAPAATFARNQGVDLEAMPRATGSGDAKNDGDQMKLMVCAGTGIMLHYYGDPSTGNLATATAMELPMLKQFGAYNKQWTDAWRDIFGIVLEEVDGVKKAVIDIDTPPILAEDVQKLGAAIGAIAAVFPEISEADEVLQSALVAIGINNVDELMKNMKNVRNAAKADKAKQQDAMMKLAGTKPIRGTPNATDGNLPVGNQLTQQETADLTAAMLKLAEAMRV